MGYGGRGREVEHLSNKTTTTKLTNEIERLLMRKKKEGREGEREGKRGVVSLPTYTCKFS